MKIMFIDSVDGVKSAAKPLRSWTKVQFGISYISAVLKSQGHDIRLMVLGSNKWNEDESMLRRAMERFNPDAICYTAVFSQYSFIEKIAAFVKSHWPKKFSIIGGVHATLNPEDCIQGPFDALCVGEGEYPMLELCKQLEAKQAPQGIANLWIKSDRGDITRTAQRDFIQNLDELPFPDREMWKEWLDEQPNDEITILTGRGCPYDCTYCSNHAIRKTAHGKYVRTRSPENIIKEIAYIYENYPHRRIYLEAEAIALDKKWAFDFCEKLAVFNETIGNSISYGCNFRVSRQAMDENLFKAFEHANFKKINIGLESGSERVRREVLKRNYSNDDFINTVSMARRHKLKVNVYNLIGIPGESVRDHMETVRVNHLCQPDELCTSIFFPYPGTELYDVCVKQGLIKEYLNTTTRERKTAVLDLPDFSRSQIQRAYKRFPSLVYRGRHSISRRFVKNLHAAVTSNVVTNIMYRKLVNLPVFSRLQDRGRKLLESR